MAFTYDVPDIPDFLIRKPGATSTRSAPPPRRRAEPKAKLSVLDKRAKAALIDAGWFPDRAREKVATMSEADKEAVARIGDEKRNRRAEATARRIAALRERGR